MGGFCHDPLGSVPVYDTLEDTKVGVVKLIIGILYLCMMFITIVWVNRNEKKVSEGAGWKQELSLSRDCHFTVTSLLSLSLYCACLPACHDACL